MTPQFNLDEFLVLANDNTRHNTINLQGKSTQQCAATFLLSSRYITDNKREQLKVVINFLNTINPNFPTYKFDRYFNQQLYMYMVEHLEFRPSSAVTYLHNLISMLHWSGRHGAELSDTYDFVPQPAYEPHRMCLTMAELAQLYYFDINTTSYRADKKRTLELVRDTFLMNAIGFGLRYSDLSRLDNSAFIGNENGFSMLQQKTGIKVTNKLDMVLFKRMFNDLQAKYPNHEIPYRGDISNYNHHLKDICKHLHKTFDDIEVIEYKVGDKIKRIERPRWKCMSSHVARRTFITQNILVMKNRIIDIQHAVGHKFATTTEGYIVFGSKD